MSISLRFFDKTPSSWQELGELVKQAFGEMGYESYRDHKLKTVRGKAVVDVYAANTSSPIPAVILCECKYWEKAVPQSVIDGFRTVCSDARAHFGIIISKSGSQAGAGTSWLDTNVHLMNFEEFQNIFFREWQVSTSMMWTKMCDQLRPILRDHEKFQDNDLNLLDKSAVSEVDVFEKYSMFFGAHGAYFSGFALSRDPLSVEINDPRGDPHQIARIRVNSRREYIEIARQAVVEATRRFKLPAIYYDDEGRQLHRHR